MPAHIRGSSSETIKTGVMFGLKPVKDGEADWRLASAMRRRPE